MRQLFILVFLLLLHSFSLVAQRGKNGNATINTAGTIVNTYTTLTSNATIGNSSITVAANQLNGAGFTGNLQQGDLIMIIQMQFDNIDGLNYNINNYPEVSWGGGVEVNSNYGQSYQNAHKYGRVANYGSVGNFELREVASVGGTTQINLTCPLENNYLSAGKVQVIRVPRYGNLTINNPGAVISPDWNGTTGGVIAIEVDGNLALNTAGAINASARGFRGGVVEGTSATGGNTPHTEGAGNGDTRLGTMNVTLGGAIGESIIGFTTEYTTLYSRYGRGALANGGGGGGPQNSGGGGGANVGDTNGHTGKGIPTPGYAAIWNLEKPNMATTLSSGGGRGGYTYANSNQNPAVNGPNRAIWGGNARKENGGYGGHALVYNPSKIFLGGGGGAGGQDSGQGGSGGRGGGIIHLTVYGTITGTGSILSNGENGQNSNPTNQTAGVGQRRGNDGAGGGGGGGYIYVKNSNPIPATVNLTANGGGGGSHSLVFSSLGGGTHELCGPGAGGAGGGITYTSGTPVLSVAGGAPGGTTSNGSQNPWSASFPMNGATSGGVGLTNTGTSIYDITAGNDTICGSQSTTLTATVTGTLPGGATIGWYTSQFGGAPVATGLTFNTPVLTTTTTYYVGTCPGTFRKPVRVVVGASPSITGTAVITNATCTAGGSISGLNASGGTGTLTYNWNGTSTPGTNLSNASAGNYTLTVTDENGCTAQSGPHTISGVGGPTISGTPVITAATCSANGTITGLVVNASVAITNYDWNGTTTPNQDLSAAQGSYTLTVTDANGCTAQSGPYVIPMTAAPVISGTAAITNENCNTGGAITGLAVTGGGTPYQFDWSGTVTTTADLTGAAAGSYTLTVTDDNGCQVQSGPYQVDEDTAPVIGGTPAVTNATCTSQGAISGLTVTGGTGTLTYQWNSNPSATIDLANVPAGPYVFVVTDANGCTDTSATITINMVGAPVINGTAVVTNATCTTQGSVTGLTVSGGTQPYTFAWNTTISATTDLTGAAAGQYTLTVTDNAGCVVQSGPYTITQVAPPVFGGTATITDATCTQGGSITGITVSGGAQPYVYAWNTNVTAQIDLLNVSAGSYTLVVTDDNGCQITSGPHVINSQGVPSITGTANVVSATCQTGGSISGLSVTGGVGPYVYEWNGDVNPTADVSDLQPGTYTLVVEDANGCTATSAPYTITAPAAPAIAGQPVVDNADCMQGGSITGVTVTGGTGPYTYSWNGGVYTTLDIFNLQVGTYTLTVTDANGCSVTGTPITVAEDVFVDARFSYSPNPASMNEPIQFHDESTGNIVSWNWELDTTTFAVTQHANYVFTQDGFYNVTLTVTDANGCVDSVTITIEVISELEAPNIITANGDGINDLFILKGLLPDTKLLIVNRWGNLIYTNDNYDNTWNGRDMSGNMVVEGVYTYAITLPDGNQKHGFVHVVHTH